MRLGLSGANAPTPDGIARAVRGAGFRPARMWARVTGAGGVERVLRLDTRRDGARWEDAEAEPWHETGR